MKKKNHSKHIATLNNLMRKGYIQTLSWNTGMNRIVAKCVFVQNPVVKSNFTARMSLHFYKGISL